MSIAIIPARGGSKRIPRKNIKPFLGKPMIAYPIEVAKMSGLFERIIVSTDDREIAEVATRFGAEAPFVRPAALADDYTGTDDVIKHAVEWLGSHGACPEYVCCVYPTSPFLQRSHLAEGYEALAASDKPFAFSVTSFPYPIQRALRIRSDGALEAMQPEYTTFRSQDLEPAFHDAGQFYWGRARAFLEGVCSHSASSIPVILPRHLVQDIDTPEDWRRAELMYRALQLGGAGDR
jgi:pseudaminic acid cytidylyltransferase